MKKKCMMISTSVICALVTSVIAGEIVAKKSEESKVVSQAETEEQTDPALMMIKERIIKPLQAQEYRRNLFSRRSFSDYTIQYELVETTEAEQLGARTFKIVSNRNSISKSSKSDTEEKLIVKVKYMTASNQILVQQGEEWVTKDKHKFLGMLAPVEAKKVKL